MNLADKAIDYVLENEGGYINDKDDPGGETNFGLSKNFLNSHPNDPLCLIKPKDITREIAKIIYFKYWWKPSYLELLNNELLAIKVFDFCINAGLQTGITLLQKAYNKIYPPNYIIMDGLMGTQTAKAINIANAVDLLEEFINQIIYHYKAIVLKHPSENKFINGWISRARKMPKED